MFLLVGGNGAANSDILQCASVKFSSHAGKLTRPVKKVARLATFLTGLVSFQKTASHFLLKGAKSIKKAKAEIRVGISAFACVNGNMCVERVRSPRVL